MEQKYLSELVPGQRGKVMKVLHRGPMGRRLMDMGLIEGTWVECVGVSPFGDPLAFLVKGAVIALRNEDSRWIPVEVEETADGSR